MNIDELTIGQAKEIMGMFGDGVNTQVPLPYKHPAIGKKCIIRTYASGVFFGLVSHVENNGGRSRCIINDCRRLYYWKSNKGISLSDLAAFGIDTKNSKICAAVDAHYIEDAIEFIPVMPEHFNDFKNAEVYNG